jgi:A/G-specific adenine glycosylase
VSRPTTTPSDTLGIDTPAGNRRFRHRLLSWYDQVQRDLPWRESRDPYWVWVSEIMLQQTRVAAVVEHYKRFLRRFPTVAKLAAARESSVLTAWSGLGYYRRARMLHAAAKKLVRDREGKFPTTAEELRELPGVGRYTAAAIASIAFDHPVAVVDGNVERLLQRVLGKMLATEELWTTANHLLAANRPGDFNQAVMELGATVCTPRQPKCLVCPVMEMCATRGQLKSAAKPPRQRKREIHYVFDGREDQVLLVQRARDAALMPGMWELPEVTNVNGSGQPWLTLRHSITVTDYVVRVTRSSAPQGTEGVWLAKTRLTKLPLTGLTRKILRAGHFI